MGMDVWIEGTLTIPAANVLEAGELLLDAIQHKEEMDIEFLPPEYAEAIKTPKGIEDLLGKKMTSIGVVLEDNGDLSFGNDDTTRREEQDQWVFICLESVFDDGEFSMSAEGHYWKWIIEDGDFSESSGETVYDHDEDAVPTIEKIVDIIYPGGKLPIGAVGHELGRGEYIEALERIENLLRETGYGPQAGMNELERMAEV